MAAKITREYRFSRLPPRPVSCEGAVFSLLTHGCTARECRDDFLFFNKTNVADMADCGRLSYKCTNESFIFFDTAGGLAPPSDCTTKAKFHLYFEDVDLTGPVSLPGVVHATSITAKGGWWARENITTAEINAMRDNPNPSEAELLNWTGGKGLQLLNISRLDLPDLVNISSGGIVMYDVGNLSSLTVPKLKYIAGPITLKLSHGPAISLSFPELYQVTRGIFISGKIDAYVAPKLSLLFPWSWATSKLISFAAWISQS